MASRTTTGVSQETVTARLAFLDYVILVKPFIIALVLIATLSGMYIAAKTLPETSLIIWTLIGISLSTAGACTLNNYIDRDIDLVMKRTSTRPLPAGGIAPVKALYMGLALGLSSTAILWFFVNHVAALLSLAALFIYVVPYTLLTKRKTPYATFIGGVGGALPPIIGYAAVRPELDIYALALFTVIFAWQHPHFWSLALKYRFEYAKAGVRNLPVVRGVETTKRWITLWAAIMALVSTFPYFLGMAGVLYLVSALAIGLLFLGMAVRFLFSERQVDMSLFFFSLVHLPVIYCMMIVDII